MCVCPAPDIERICRVPCAVCLGLQGLFAFLDEAGVSTFAQRAIWGAFAGGTAAWLTTPFDLLTTNVMLEAESAEEGVIEGLDEGAEKDTDWRKRPSAAGRALRADTADTAGTGTTAKGASPGPRPPGLAAEVVQIFTKTIRDTLAAGGPAALFTGAIPRLLFFAPSGMLFFAFYESCYDAITIFQTRAQ